VNEYVKFMTEQLTYYVNNHQQKRTKTDEKDLYKSHWFGLFPLLFRILWKK